MDEKLAILKGQQPSVIINHSRPFPIALVEDKTNVVYTKALLFLHLFKSYSSQCINCPWCKRFLSVGEFSKHVHLDEIEDSEDDEDSDDITESEESSNEGVDGPDRKSHAKQNGAKRQRKLDKIKQKSFKILPYCISINEDGQTTNDELNEHEIRTWKTFGDRFAQFKLIRTQNQKKQKEFESLVRAKQEVPSGASQKKFHSAASEQLNASARFKSNSVLAKPSQNETVTFSDWDNVNKENKLFYLDKEKIDFESVTYLRSDGNRLSEAEEDSEDDSNGPLDVKKNGNGSADIKTDGKLVVREAIKRNDDFALSEEEDEEEQNVHMDHSLVNDHFCLDLFLKDFNT